MFKLTFRSILYIIIIPIAIIIYYIGFGHKQYSVLENYQELIVNNINNKYGVDITYEKLTEEWDYLKPHLEIKNIKIKNKEGFNFESENLAIRLDLIYFLMAQKLKIKKVNIENSILNLKHNTQNNNEENISFLKNINIDRINIKNLDINLKLDSSEYNLKDFNLNYTITNDFFTIDNDNIKIKQFITKSDYYKTEIESDTKSIIKFIKKHGFENYTKEIGYGTVFNSEGKVDIISNFKNQEDFNLEFKFKDNKVNLISEQFVFTDFNGSIYFNSLDKKVYSNVMKCKTNNKECTFEIKNNKNNIQLAFSAYANEETLSKYLYFIDNSNFKGETKITGIYDVNKSFLQIKSDLKGLEVINIPIISKDKNDSVQMDLKTYLKDKEQYLDLKIGEVQIFLDLVKHNTQIYFNQPIKKYNKIKTNLYVSGEVTNLDIEQTLNFIDNLKFEESNSKFIYDVDLKLKKPSYLKMSPEFVNYLDNNGIANINIIDPDLNGVFNYDIKNKNLKGIIENFKYNIDNEKTINKDIDMSKMPNLDIEIKEIIINKYNGQLSFNGKHNNDSYIIDNIEGLINNIKPNFIVKIDKGKNINTSLISINDNKLFEFDDISKIFESYGYENTITSKNGIVYGGVDWEGLYPNIKTLNGNVNFEINNGKVNITNAGLRVIKVFKIFEMNMINELFNLDFDFIKKGTKYKKLSGKGKFIDGVYHIDKNIEMKSDNYNAKINGKIDFLNEKFENNIKIDLPVSQKLPTLALLSGNPIAIAGVWAADKLLGEQINKLTRIKFNIKGNFENPNISK